MTSTTEHTARKSVWKHGIAAAIVAAAVTTGLAYVASQAGVSFVDPAHAGDPHSAVRFRHPHGGLLADRRRPGCDPRPHGSPPAVDVRPNDARAARSLSIVPDFVEIPKLSPDFDTATALTLAADACGRGSDRHPRPRRPARNRAVKPTKPPRLLRLRGSGGFAVKRESDRHLMILVTRPAPTVRPPSRMANRWPSSSAMGWMRVTLISVLSPGMTISVPSGSVTTPVTSVVRT